jgi:hypothetical protein
MRSRQIRSGKSAIIATLLILISSLPASLPRVFSHQDREPEALRVINVATEANTTILGATASQHLSGSGTSGNFNVSLSNLHARAIATGDFNGDGIADAIIGAPDATFTVGSQTRSGAGICYIVFGKTGLSGTIDTSAGQVAQILGSNPGDRLGFSLAAGDVNGDGIADIVIGAPGADFPGSTNPSVPPRNDTGAVFVIFGSNSLSSTSKIDLATANAANVAIYGVNTNDQFGTAVAVGNVGGLSTDPPAQQAVKDILIGAPGTSGPDGSSRPGGGAAYVIFGGSRLNPIAGATTILDLANNPANVIVFGKTGDALGASVAIGDINSGGIADIIIGAPLADRPASGSVPAATDTGAVFAVFGGNNLTPTTGTSKIFDINAGQQNLSVYGAGNRFNPGTDDADHLGLSVAAGDVTGDGIDDLLIGAPDADGPSEDRPSAGEAYVIQGGPALNPSTGSERRIDLFSGGATLTVFGAQTLDRLGSTVAAGSYNTPDNNDRILDLIIGAPGALNRAGLISIIFGGPNLLLVPTRDLFLAQDNIRILGQSSANNDLSNKTMQIRQTLTTPDQSTTPYLQKLTVTVGSTSFVNDDTQAQFATGTLTNTIAASTTISGDTTAPGDLELAPNKSLTLNGSSAFMQVANSASLKPGNGSWTVEFWIKKTGSGTGSDFLPIIGSRPWSGANDKGWSVALSSSSGNLAVHFADQTTGFDSVQSTAAVSTGSWEHWAVVFDRNQGVVQFYRNGALNSTTPVAFPIGAVDQTDPILIGADKASGGSRFFQGNLDDIRVWNLARTSQQIQDNFKKELQGNETGLVAYWNFNANNTNDLTSNANNGTLMAGASLIDPPDRRYLSGTRLSLVTFPNPTSATSSSVTWVATTSGGTVKIETSIDGGATFQTATNGSPIPSINAGDELGWAFATADINNSGGGDLLTGASFANVNAPSGFRAQAGIVYILPSTATPPPINNPPTVKVIAPNGGEVLQVGTTFDIKWTASDPDGDNTIQKFTIQLSTNAGTSFNFTVAQDLPGNLRSFSWVVPVGFNTTQGRIRVIVTDNQGATAQDDSDANFTITDQGVAVTLVSPNGGQNFKFGQQVNITWSVASGSAALVKGFDLLLSTDGGQTFTLSIVPNPNPTQPALGPTARSYAWTAPSLCALKARILVVATSQTNLKTQDASDADFSITDFGPTIDTNNMFIFDNFTLLLLTTQPPVGNEIRFDASSIVEVSSDAAGTQFFTFSKPAKLKKDGRKFISKGTINNQDLGVFFPNGATRIIRITNPPCGITVLRVTRSGEQLLLVSAAESNWQ